MFVDGVKDIRLVGRRELVNEGVGWGIKSMRAEYIVDQLFAGSKQAMHDALAKYESVTERWLASHLSNRIL